MSVTLAVTHGLNKKWPQVMICEDGSYITKIAVLICALFIGIFIITITSESNVKFLERHFSLSGELSFVGPNFLRVNEMNISLK